MTLVTLRPDGVVKQTGTAWTNVGGAASLQAAVSDNLDTTYIACAGGPAGTIHFSFGTSALPVAAVIKSITPRIRSSQAAGGATIQIAGYAPWIAGLGTPTYYTIPASIMKPTPTITTRAAAAGGWFLGENNSKLGYRSPQSAVDAIVLTIYNRDTVAGQDHRIYEVYLDVVYDEAPVASNLVLSPTNAATKTLTPTFAWDYLDPEGSPQAAWAIAIWTAADAADGNFPWPFTTSFTKAGGGTATSAYNAQGTTEIAHAITTALASGTAYKAYITVADSANGQVRWSGSWVSLSFTPSVVPPPAPVAPVVTAEMASYRYKIDLAAQANLLTETAADPETGISEFFASTNVTIAHDVTTPAATGVGTLKMTSIAAGTMIARTNINTPVVAGKLYQALASYRSAATSRQARVNIDFRNAAGASVGVSTGPLSATPVGSYTQYASGGFTAPAGAVVAWIQLELQGTAAGGEVLNVDKLLLAPDTSGVWSPGGQYVGRKIEVEHSLDGGTFWSSIPLTVPPLALGSENNQQLTTYDTLIMGTRTPRYRARTRWVDPVTNLESVSPWSTVTVAASAAVVDKFVLRDPDNADSFVVLPLSMGNWDDDTDEQIGVFNTVGGSYPVVVSSGFNSRRMPMQATIRNAFESVTFKQLRAGRKSLLLLDDLGGFTWVRFGENVRHSMVRSPSRKSIFTRVEVFDFELIESISPTGLPQLIY